MNRTFFLKCIDALVGQWLVYFLSLFKEQTKNFYYRQPEKVLLIRPGGIGDAVLLLPVVDALKERFPEATIDILAERRNSAVFSLGPGINMVFHYDNPLELLSVLRRRYSVVIDSEQWYRLSAVVVKLIKTEMSIGFGTNERGRLFTQCVSYSQDEHELDSFLHLLSPLTKERIPTVVLPFLSIPQSTLENIRSYIHSLEGKRIISLFPGGSIPEKRWNHENFYDLASLLVEHGYAVVLLGGKEDQIVANKISGSLSFTINCSGKLSLAETAAVIKESCLLVSGDSGIMHIASAVGTKIIALFGPSSPKKWAPRLSHSVIINKHLKCSPCSRFGNTPRCRRKNECMNLISVNEVFDNVIKLLEI